MRAVEEVMAITRNTVLTSLDDETLCSVLMTFPAAIVAAADGVLDDTERQFLFNMCDALADGEADEGTPERALLTAEIYSTILGLLAHRSDIEAPLLAAINEEIGRDQNITNFNIIEI